MSDDTPTEKYQPPRAPDDDATRRLDQVPDAATRRLDEVAAPATLPFAAHVPMASLPPEVPPFSPVAQGPTAAAPPPRARAVTPDTADRPSRAPMFVLIAIATLLVAALAIYLLTLATRNGPASPVASPSTSASASPTSTPSDAPSPTPTPTLTPTPTPEPVVATFTGFTPANGSTVLCDGDNLTTPLEFTWTSDDAESAWIGEGTTDAKADPTAQVDPSGSYSDFDFSCEVKSQVYTVTLESADGELTSQSVTLIRQLAE